jgi:hypothetical protein
MFSEVFLFSGPPASNARVILRLTFTAIAIAMMCGRAQAERVVSVDAEGAPFAADDLAAALRLRLTSDGAPVSVQVRPTTAGRVTVDIGDTSRDIDLEGRTGRDAARLVALEIIDLALDDLAVVPERKHQHEIAIELLGSATAYASALAGATASLAYVRDAWVGALEVSGGERIDGDLHMSGATVRACAGIRVADLELRAGLAIAPTWVSNGAGDQTTMLGATASARLQLPVSPGTRVVLAVGADAYATQTTYRLGMEAITTPWIAPWVGLGMELAR